MSLSQALNTALSGLRANQIGLSTVAANVANAETPGYIRKTVNQLTTTSGDIGASVRIAGINRELDQYVQRQLRIEQSGASYANLRADYLSRLQSIYGDPGSQGTIEAAFSNFTSAIQALSTSSDSQSARINVVNTAQALAQQLNSASNGIQSLRNDAELGLADSVARANNAMQQIASINNQLKRTGGTDAASAALLDSRDQYIQELSKIMDIRVVANDANQVNVFTNSGVQLVGTEASTISFDTHGTITANTLWSANNAQRNVGTLTLTFPQGGSLDLIQTKAIRSGELAAYVELRDTALVQAQTQLDQMAAVMASALSDKTTAGTAATSGAASGFDLDLSGLQNGNTISLTYTDTTGPTQHRITLKRVNDPSILPLSNNATTDPNDQVIGIDFSGGMASVVTQLNTALGGANLTFSNPSGNVLRVLDDGAAGLSNVDAASVTATMTSLTSGNAELPFFTDGGQLYTGALTAGGSQMTGFASRITVNSTLLGDPTRTVIFSTSPQTPSGDTTRPDFLYDKLVNGQYYYSPTSGIGTNATPFNGTIASFSRQFIAQQGQQAEAATQLKQGQDVVLSTLEQKFNASAGINIDQEMANLLALQNAYAANARVMSVVKDMFTALMNA